MAEILQRNLTILLTDIKDFTPKTARKSRVEVVEMLEANKRIVLATLEAKGGKLVKTIGDAFLMVFESATDAVLAGVAVQDALREYNADKKGDDRLEVRVAINLGEVTLTDNDVFGDPVNITARIEGIAEANEVYFTEAVYLAMNKKEVPSSEIGLFQLKGVAERIRVYKVVRERPVPGLVSSPAVPATGLLRFFRRDSASPGPRKELPRVALWRRGAAALIDVILVSMFIGFLPFGKDEKPLSLDLKVLAEEKARHDRAEAVGQAVSEELRKADKLEISKDGIKIGKGISIGARGARIGDKVRIDDSGVRIKGESSERKGPRGRRANAETGDDEESQHVDVRATGKKPIFPLFWVLSSTLFLMLWSATPGKRFLNIRVVETHGRALDWKIALIRSLFSLVSASVMLLGYLWALWGKDRKTWHDIIAGTAVVEGSGDQA